MSKPIGACSWRSQSGRDAIRDERIRQSCDLGAAADQTDVAKRFVRQPAKDVEVLAMSARQHDNEGRLGDRGRPPHPATSSTTTSSAARKALVVGKFLTVVDDVQAEADGWRDLTELIADVARADDVQPWRRLDRLDEDVHLSSADQARLLARSSLSS